MIDDAHRINGECSMSIFQREPARVAGVITNFITAVLMAGAAFGLDLSEMQQNVLLGLIVPTIAMIQLMFELTRSQVVPTAKAEPLIETALTTDPIEQPEKAEALRAYDLSGARLARESNGIVPVR